MHEVRIEKRGFGVLSKTSGIGFQEAEESYALHITFLQYMSHITNPQRHRMKAHLPQTIATMRNRKKGLGAPTSEILRPETRLNASLHHSAKSFLLSFSLFTRNPMHDFALEPEPLSESMALFNQRLIALLRLRSVGVGLGKPDCTTKTPLSELQVSLAVPEIHPCARPPLSPDIHPRLSGWEGLELRLSS